LENKGNRPTSILIKYDYLDENGKLLYRKVRGKGKKFWFERIGENGKVVKKVGNTRRVLYRLPELIKSSGTVYIVGGEKDVNTLRQYDLTATTNDNGEGNWKNDFNQYFKGRDVVILEDNDEKGRKHGRIVSESLYDTAKSIKIVRFDNLQKGGDASDFLVNSSIKELMDLVDNAPAFSGSYKDYFGETEDSQSIGDAGDAGDDEKRTQSQLLVGLASDWELFHSDDGVAFATFPNKGHHETYKIRSQAIELLLSSRFYEQNNKPPNKQSLSDALRVLEAKAMFDGKEHQVFIRIAELKGNIYLDLCNERWEVVEITSKGWQIISNSPVKLIRNRGMRSIPEPLKGGSIDELQEFLNIKEEQWKLVVGFLVACLKPKGPYPILCIQGEQGSGKSFFCRLIKNLIDPSCAPLKTLPRDERDLMIAARNAWLLVFDNLSGLPPWISDAICRLSTGGGFSTRELHTDDSEIIFDSQRPQVLNGIDDISTRPDLCDRSIIICLPVIPKDQRKDEEIILKKYEKAMPLILGGLLDGIVAALKNKDSVQLENAPRMADFAKWVTASESGLGFEQGSFMKAYSNNRAAAIEIGLESDPLAQSVIDLSGCEAWEGTATELLEDLTELVPDKLSKSKVWPKTPQSLSNRLRRLAPVLREIGIEIEFARESNTGRRRILISEAGEKSVTTVTTVTGKSNLNESKGLFDGISDDGSDDAPERPSRLNSLKNNEGDDSDDGDDEIPAVSSDSGNWETEI